MSNSLSEIGRMLRKSGHRPTREGMVLRDIQNCHGQLGNSNRMGSSASRAGGSTNYVWKCLSVVLLDLKASGKAVMKTPPLSVEESPSPSRDKANLGLPRNIIAQF